MQGEHNSTPPLMTICTCERFITECVSMFMATISEISTNISASLMKRESSPEGFRGGLATTSAGALRG